MKLQYARTFVTVAELGTVSKAALRLRIAQPALSRQINALEQELGLKLFDRVASRLVLTSDGEQLVNDCRDLLSYAGAISERAQLLRGGETGVLKVACSPQIIESVVANFLCRYAERYPHVRVKLIEAIGWSDIRGMLERGEIHLGQNLLHAVPPGDGRFAAHPLEPVDLLAACHPTLQLGKDGAIEIDALAPYPLLLLDLAFVFRKNFDAASRLAGLEPNVAFESRAPHSLLAMAESGHGVAIIPSALRTERYALRLVSVTYRGRPLSEPLTMFSYKRRPLPRYAEAFCEMLAEYTREVFPISSPRELGSGIHNLAEAPRRRESPSLKRRSAQRKK
jgi:DNA-binding transcriptional LysR family regulator